MFLLITLLYLKTVMLSTDNVDMRTEITSFETYFTNYVYIVCTHFLYVIYNILDSLTYHELLTLNIFNLSFIAKPKKCFTICSKTAIIYNIVEKSFYKVLNFVHIFFT